MDIIGYKIIYDGGHFFVHDGPRKEIKSVAYKKRIFVSGIFFFMKRQQDFSKPINKNVYLTLMICLSSSDTVSIVEDAKQR